MKKKNAIFLKIPRLSYTVEMFFLVSKRPLLVWEIFMCKGVPESIIYDSKK